MLIDPIYYGLFNSKLDFLI